MTISAMISRLRKYISNTDYSDVSIVQDITKAYKELYTAIVKEVWEDYFRTTSLMDAVADQEVYTLTKPTSTVSAFSKIVGIYIKYPTDTNYKVCRFRDLRNSSKSLSEMLDNSSASTPLYYNTETELYILPKFTSETTGSGSNEQIKVVGIASAIDLETISTEADILIPVEYHENLILGALIEIYRYKNKVNLKNDVMVEFKREKERMLYELKNTDLRNDNILLPDDTYLQY